MFERTRKAFKVLKIFYKGNKLLFGTIYRLAKNQNGGTIFLGAVFGFSILFNTPRAYNQHLTYRKLNSNNNFGFYDQY